MKLFHKQKIYTAELPQDPEHRGIVAFKVRLPDSLDKNTKIQAPDGYVLVNRNTKEFFNDGVEIQKLSNHADLVCLLKNFQQPLTAAVVFPEVQLNFGEDQVPCRVTVCMNYMVEIMAYGAFVYTFMPSSCDTYYFGYGSDERCAQIEINQVVLNVCQGELLTMSWPKGCTLAEMQADLSARKDDLENQLNQRLNLSGIMIDLNQIQVQEPFGEAYEKYLEFQTVKSDRAFLEEYMHTQETIDQYVLKNQKLSQKIQKK